MAKIARKEMGITINNLEAQQQIYDHIVSKYNKIKVKSGKCRYNFRCQMNAVHEAKKHKHKKIAMCVYMDEGTYPIIHFINYHKGKFIDNTLGEWSSQYDYYFIRWIEDEDMWNVNHVFTAFRTELRKKLSWWVRITSDFDA